MNGAGSAQHGLLMAIYFSRKGDSALSTVQSLFRSFGSREENFLKHHMDVVIFVDRGYHVASVTNVFEDSLLNPGNSFRKSWEMALLHRR
jgi:hypothetical protein